MIETARATGASTDIPHNADPVPDARATPLARIQDVPNYSIICSEQFFRRLSIELDNNELILLKYPTNACSGAQPILTIFVISRIYAVNSKGKK